MSNKIWDQLRDIAHDGAVIGAGHEMRLVAGDATYSFRWIEAEKIWLPDDTGGIPDGCWDIQYRETGETEWTFVRKVQLGCCGETVDIDTDTRDITVTIYKNDGNIFLNVPLPDGLEEGWVFVGAGAGYNSGSFENNGNIQIYLLPRESTTMPESPHSMLEALGGTREDPVYCEWEDLAFPVVMAADKLRAHIKCSVDENDYVVVTLKFEKGVSDE